jgi:hypothetical protein
MMKATKVGEIETREEERDTRETVISRSSYFAAIKNDILHTLLLL